LATLSTCPYEKNSTAAADSTMATFCVLPKIRLPAKSSSARAAIVATSGTAMMLSETRSRLAETR
jgi:hypothetical protein